MAWLQTSLNEHHLYVCTSVIWFVNFRASCSTSKTQTNAILLFQRYVPMYVITHFLQVKKKYSACFYIRCYKHAHCLYWYIAVCSKIVSSFCGTQCFEKKKNAWTRQESSEILVCTINVWNSQRSHRNEPSSRFKECSLICWHLQPSTWRQWSCQNSWHKQFPWVVYAGNKIIL